MSAPRHLAIIPDGNRRWARARGHSPQAGHRAGVRALGPTAAAAWSAGVEVFSFWWGSPANLTRRAPEEVAAIVDALRGWLLESAPDLLRAHGARFEVHGRWRTHCPALADGIAAAEAASGDGPRRLVLLMAYDGREEMLSAVESSAGDPEGFQRALWTGHLPPVDLLIRTGGEPHLSAGFLMWLIADAQLRFDERRWPDFGPAALDEALEGYRRTERRFGR